MWFGLHHLMSCMCIPLRIPDLQSIYNIYIYIYSPIFHPIQSNRDSPINLTGGLIKKKKNIYRYMLYIYIYIFIIIIYIYIYSIYHVMFLNPCFFSHCLLVVPPRVQPAMFHCPVLRSTEGLRLSTKKTRSGQWYTIQCMCILYIHINVYVTL